MKIKKAFCEQLGRTVDIVAATDAYLAQEPVRRDLLFFCSSPECERLSPQVQVTAVNYKKVPSDNEESESPPDKKKPRVMKEHFKKHISFEHSDDCQWVIEEQAAAEFVDEAESNDDRKRRQQRVAADGLLEGSTFLTQGEPREQEDDTQNVLPGDDDNAASNGRRRRVDRAKDRLKRPKRSALFSELVSSHLKVVEHKLFDEPVTVAGIGETTWGHLFFPIDWYSEDNKSNHVFKGNVSIGDVYPPGFDIATGIPAGIALTFYDEVTVGDVRARPSIYIKRDEIKSTPGAYVLIEAIRLAKDDDKYKGYLQCYFYGSIEQGMRKGKNPEKTLNVIVYTMSTLELRTIDA